MELKKNQVYQVNIESYSSEGLGVCRVEGRAVFVPKTILGECWEIRLVKVTKTAVYARAERLLTPSPERRESQCPVFPLCGGCDLWHMSYEEELRFKLGRVNDSLAHIGRQTLRAEEILGSDTVLRYRNKGIFAVADVNGFPAAGFYRERSHELIPVGDCLIQNELSGRAASAVLSFMKEHAVPAYDEASGDGCIRHVFCRKAQHTDDAAVCVVTARGLGAKTAALVDVLRSEVPELTGIVLNVNRSRGNTVLAGDFYTLWGKSEITDMLCGSWFSIAPQAFFQINPPQAEKLYQRALSYAAPDRNSLVFDLYCGAGTISLCLAREAGRVIGAEIVPEAVENAKKNAAANGLENTEFICADAGDAANLLRERGLRPDIVVVDPPRKGMSEDAVTAVASMQPERLVYVSCNPSTLARDILRLNGYGYQLRAATVVDMFPRTCHVESVVLMTSGSVGMKQFFESKSIRFVEVSEALIKDYLTMVNDYEHVGRLIGGSRKTYTEEQEIKWVREKLEEKALVFSMIEKETDAFVGNIELMDVQDSSAELGIAITAEKQEHGYGTEAIRALVNYGMDALGLDRITLKVIPTNSRAIHVYENCGFREYNRTEERVSMEIKR